jgi:hypothetical protein
MILLDTVRHSKRIFRDANPDVVSYLIPEQIYL